MTSSLTPPYEVDREAIHGKNVRFSLTVSVNHPSITVANGKGILSICGDTDRGVVEIHTHDSKNPNRHITYQLTELQAGKLERNQRGDFNLVV